MSKRESRIKAFTMIELMVSIGLLMLALVAILPISMYFLRSNLSLGNYVLMANESRHFTEQLGLDLRSTVDVTRSDNKRLTITIEDPDGNSSTIAYRYRTGTKALTRKVDSEPERTLIDNISSLRFGYYDSQDQDAKNSPLDIKKIDVAFTTVDSVLKTEQTQYTRVARFVLRNRKAAN